MKRRSGFTLAETLLVLVIIGVVCALTIPTTITKIRDIKRRSQVQVIASVLSNAGSLASNENGGSLKNLNSDFLKKYLIVLKTASGNDNSLGLRNVSLQDGSMFPETFNNEKYALANGIVIMPRMIFPNCDYAQQHMNNICGDIIVNVDGAKGRSVAGEDVFYFWITSTGIVANRVDSPNDAYPIYLKGYTNDCQKNGTGWACSGQLITGGNLP